MRNEPRDTELAEQVTALLDELADGCQGPDDVARKLADAGCRGERNECFSCPIAVWLISKLCADPARDAVAANYFSAEVRLRPEGERERYAKVPMPKMLREFMDCFDDLDICPYAELVA